MAIRRTSEITPKDGITLRDAQHAYNLYQNYDALLTPKVKFLYHVDFSFRNAGQSSISETQRKQIGILAKRVELPQYTAQIVTKQQYNRKKHVQTRIDYSDVNIVFHDDNQGETRSMFQKYYNYYYRDGTESNTFKFDPRDKYSSSAPPRYGLDNGTVEPFFNFITIYQLGRERWFSYILINPIASRWGHDTLDYSDGAGMMENTMVINYEGVLYNSGNISDITPVGYTDPETGYDQSGNLGGPLR